MLSQLMENGEVKYSHHPRKLGMYTHIRYVQLYCLYRHFLLFLFCFNHHHILYAVKEACSQYWPNEGSVSFGEFTVELIGEEELPGFILRKMNIKSFKVCPMQ